MTEAVAEEEEVGESAVASVEEEGEAGRSRPGAVETAAPTRRRRTTTPPPLRCPGRSRRWGSGVGGDYACGYR